MKRAFSTIACLDYSYEQLAECAVRNRVSALEIRLDGNDRVCGMEDSYLPEMVSLFESKGLSEVSALYGYKQQYPIKPYLS